MRLICPNCAAQYDIDAVLIPKGGRDVQCSGCGRTWFERGRDAATPAAPIVETDPPARDDDASETSPDTSSVDRGEPSPTVDADRGASETPVADAPAAEAAESTGPPAAPPRRELDPRTRAILLEEAERESAARRGTDRPAAQGALAAPQLGPPGPPGPRKPFLGAPQTSPPRASFAPAPKTAAPSNALLPDVEEINSSLTPRARPSAPRPPARPDRSVPQTEKPRGLALGFVIALGLAILLAALYLAAPAIIDAVPAAEQALATYVGAVDALIAR